VIEAPNEYERRWAKGEPVEHVLTVNGTDGPVAQIVYTDAPNDPGRTLYLHREALGSVGLVTDNDGGEYERTYFDPFGAKVDAYGAAMSPEMGDVKLGFTGHRHDDELGLIDMRGRVYDATQKRFLSPDPHVTDPVFGQNYNRYSYVLNNPLRYTDPTGFNPDNRSLMTGVSGLSTNGQDAGGVINMPLDLCLSKPAAPKVASSDETGHKEADTPDSTITITVEEGTDEGRAADNHARGAQLLLNAPSNVRLPGDDGMLHKAHGSHRDPKPVDHSLLRELASDAGEMLVRTGLCYTAGEAGCLVGQALFSGGTDMIEGGLKANGGQVRAGARRVLQAVAPYVASEIVKEALAATNPVKTIRVTNSAGESRDQTVVSDQDELLRQAEEAAGGSLDNFTERKPGRWISPDGLKQIEWSPEGHSNTNEGPHVTVQERSDPKERWRVTKKVFIEGQREYER